MSTDDYSSVNEAPVSPDEDGDVYRILDDQGQTLPHATVPDLSDEALQDLYRDMKRARLFDKKMNVLAKRGDIESYAPVAGQEAQISSLYAIDQEDAVFPTYRDNAAMQHRLGMDNLLAELHGRADGNTSEDAEMFPTAIPIATQIPHSVGWSWAAKLKGDDRIALAYLGDGATSEGDFHEGMNFAGVHGTPTVFLCQNNQYAISTPVNRQTAADTIAQKAVAYGFEGVQVDGMDPLAVYDVIRAAAEKARSPADTVLGDHLPIDPDIDHDFIHNQDVAAGPTLIEADMYRFGPHTLSDDPSRYRSEDEVEAWQETDPLPRLEQYLRSEGLLYDTIIEQMEQEIQDEIDAAIDTVEHMSGPDPEELFRHVYSDMPDRLEDQYDRQFGDGRDRGR